MGGGHYELTNNISKRSLRHVLTLPTSHRFCQDEFFDRPGETPLKSTDYPIELNTNNFHLRLSFVLLIVCLVGWE
jgi:hypothetical protein